MRSATLFTARILLVSILAARSLVAQAVELSEHWAASWYTAQADYLEGMPPTYPAPAGKILANQTLRQIMYVSADGSKVRLKLSNLFGDAPVTFDAVTIVATSGSDASIDAATARVANFSGSASVTLAAHMGA